MSAITHNASTGGFSLSPVKTRNQVSSPDQQPQSKTRIFSPPRQYTSHPLEPSPLVSKLMETKSNKKRLKMEQQALLNRVKYLEEEEQKAKMRLAKAMTEQEKHEQSKQLKESYEVAKKKYEEMQGAYLERVRDMSVAEKERRRLFKDKLTSHHRQRSKEIEEVRQKKQYFKQLGEFVKEQLKNNNQERADSSKKEKLAAKQENERVKEQIKRMKMEERRANRRKNEQQYREMRSADVKNKSEIVKYIKDNRMTFEKTHNHLRQLSQEKVVSTMHTQMIQEEQQARHISEMIEYLKVQEQEAKRRLESTKRTLEKVGSNLASISPAVYESLSPKKNNKMQTYD